MLNAIVVDDEKIIRETLFNNIPWQSFGFSRVEQARNGVQALEIAQQHQPDLVLCDIRMPIMNGIDLGKQIRYLYPDCKLIFLSAYSDKEYLKSAIQLSAVDYIEKPLVLHDISKLIQSTAISCMEEKKFREESSALIKQKLAKALCQPHYDPDLLFNSLPLTRVPLEGNYRTVLIQFNLSKHAAANERSILYATHKALLDVCLKEYRLQILADTTDPDHFILHCSLENENSEQQLNAALQHYINELQFNHTQAFVSIGSRVSGLLQLFSSYKLAASQLNLLFYKGYNQVIQDLAPESSNYKFPDNIAELFYQYLKENQKESAFLLLQRIIHDIEISNQSPVNYIKNGFFSIVLKMNHFLEEQHLAADEFIGASAEGKTFFWETISSITTLAEMKLYISQLTETIFDQLNNESNQNDAAFGIKKYILEHLHEPDLSIHSVAQRFFLTPNYASFVFKKGTHMTINQYMTAVRMDKAKGLLVNDKNTLVEIAAKVGYSDPKYFARVFKKELGLTTSEYRERHIR